MKISVVSGGFDPIHSGHIEYFKSAKNFGDKLIVALNSDEWLIGKKTKYFMPFNERFSIIQNLQMVDEVIGFDDDEHGSCSNALRSIKSQYPNDEIIFCNGGDRNQKNIPEMDIEGIKFEFGVGGENKANSSSWILKKWQFDSEERIWGKFYNLYLDDRMKLKELIIAPGKGMSFQKHFYRNEIWFISKGKCSVNFSQNEPEDCNEIILNTEEVFHVKQGEWHQIINRNNDPCHIIEIQYGEKTTEEDIERLYFFDETDS
jgi:cytidyltransferase-like protein